MNNHNYDSLYDAIDAAATAGATPTDVARAVDDLRAERDAGTDPADLRVTPVLDVTRPKGVRWRVVRMVATGATT